MKVSKIFIILFSVLIPLKTFSIDQRPDVLIYKGERYYLLTNPLESYYDAGNPRPLFSDRKGRSYGYGVLAGICSDLGDYR